jgi:hypothetical protein
MATTTTNTGSAYWTYATNATECSTITILQSRMYSGTLTVCSAEGGALGVGWTLNASEAQRDADPYTITGFANLAHERIGAVVNQYVMPSCSFRKWCNSNDVLRIQQTVGVTPGITTACRAILCAD